MPSAGSSPTVLRISRQRAVAYRLHINHVIDRLPAGSYEQAAYVGLQDTAPRDAVLGMHARMSGCKPDSWQHPSLIQTYSPRDAVYVLPVRDFGVFTLGRLPLADGIVRAIEDAADRICRDLDGQELRGGRGPELRFSCASGRIALRWTTSSLWVREVPRPTIDIDDARRELCRRHVHFFAPTNPRTFAWWAGLPAADGVEIWNRLADEFFEVDFAGTRAWVLRSDRETLESAPPPRATRLLVESDLRLLGRDRDGLFIAPGKRRLTPAADTFHPNGVLVDGRIVGAWGRKGGRVDVVLAERLTAERHDEVLAEAAAFPIRGGVSAVISTLM